MDPVAAFEWGRLFIGEQPVLYFLEILLRVVVIYVVSLLVLRIGGKRSRRQLTPLEMLLVVALGSAVGDVLFYPTVAIAYTVVVLVAVMGLQLLMEWLKQRSSFMERFVNSTPTRIIEEGKIVEGALAAEQLTRDELYSSLRQEGISNLGQVKHCFLELSGQFSVFEYEKGEEKQGEDILPTL